MFLSKDGVPNERTRTEDAHWASSLGCSFRYVNMLSFVLYASWKADCVDDVEYFHSGWVIKSISDAAIFGFPVVLPKRTMGMERKR